MIQVGKEAKPAEKIGGLALATNSPTILRTNDFNYSGRHTRHLLKEKRGLLGPYGVNQLELASNASRIWPTAPAPLLALWAQSENGGIGVSKKTGGRS